MTTYLFISWQARGFTSTRTAFLLRRECNVYSCDILPWEIFNDGEQPFEGTINKSVKTKTYRQIFRSVLNLYRRLSSN
ncbi:hypothetical protein KIN20_020031 [Parelaphostrongylus tenuis]|uniref:Uncharacterized protein n=1 Tax=Parelaphostrongylus tenuis TaxID=148309 RepID=A0AAD5N9D5_PARTN|nr:hypothetical protein KIN20_020031 [Parelaphostrongylus tenuis]